LENACNNFEDRKKSTKNPSSIPIVFKLVVPEIQDTYGNYQSLVAAETPAS